MDRLTRIALAALSLVALVVIASTARGPIVGASVPSSVSAGRVAPAGSMHDARASHSSTLLADGRVLIAGGMVENGVFLDTAEVYDPVKSSFLLVAPMKTRRTSHTATPLPDGRVLIAGGLAGRHQEGGRWVGETQASIEAFDPRRNSFVPAGDMTTPREGHAAVLLKNGKLLLVGGSAFRRLLASAELYDPATGKSTPTGSMTRPRAGFSAVLLNDGRVLVTGGSTEDRQEVLAAAEIYDPGSGKWSPTGDLTVRRHKHAATVLSDGRVLITGGSDDRDWSGQYRSAEIFDPATGRFSSVPDMNKQRFKLPYATALLKNGNALIAGGSEVVEIYDARANRFVPAAGSVEGPHYFASATLLSDGRVLIAGGYGTGGGRANGPLSSDRAWIYQP